VRSLRRALRGARLWTFRKLADGTRGMKDPIASIRACAGRVAEAVSVNLDKRREATTMLQEVRSDVVGFA